MKKNIFELAELQLHREGKAITEEKILDYSIRIRKWLNKHNSVADKILAGYRFYQYGNIFKRVN